MLDSNLDGAIRLTLKLKSWVASFYKLSARPVDYFAGLATIAVLIVTVWQVRHEPAGTASSAQSRPASKPTARPAGPALIYVSMPELSLQDPIAASFMESELQGNLTADMNSAAMTVDVAVRKIYVSTDQTVGTNNVYKASASLVGTPKWTTRNQPLASITKTGKGDDPDRGESINKALHDAARQMAAQLVSVVEQTTSN